MQGTVLLVHKNKKFSHQTVYVTGHAFQNCVFECCTMVVKGRPTTDNFDEHCKLDGCVWHLDMIVHDYRDWQLFYKVPQGKPMAQLIYDSLPKPPLDDQMPGVEDVPVPEDVS